MHGRVTKLRLAAAGLLVLAGIGLGSILSPLVGDALATVGQVVNISDHSASAYFATVDRTGALKTNANVTGGNVGQAIPRLPWFARRNIFAGQNPVINANTATVALTRISIENYFGQTNGATIQVLLTELGGDATTCDGSSEVRHVGVYEVRAGDVYSENMESPIVLQPLAAGHVWCLQATLTVQGSPGSYFLPNLSTSGFVASGTLPPGTLDVSAAPPGAAPPKATLPKAR